MTAIALNPGPIDAATNGCREKDAKASVTSEGAEEQHTPRRPPGRVELPDALLDVALVDATVCAATGGASISLWYEDVRAGRAPQPVIRGPRFTRWRLLDVKRYWAERAAQGVNGQAAERMTAQARKASAAKQSKRTAGTQS